MNDIGRTSPDADLNYVSHTPPHPESVARYGYASLALFILFLVGYCNVKIEVVKTMDEDEILGRLTWNDACDSWDSSVEVSPTIRVRISLIPLDSDVKPLIEHAKEFVLGFSDFDSNLRDAAVSSLLDDCNYSWNEGQKRFSSEEFLKRISLDGVCFWPDGKAEANYFDGGLFGGHFIVVPFTRDGAIDDAFLEG